MNCTGCYGTGQVADYVGLDMKCVADTCPHCGGSGAREDELKRLIAANQERHLRLSRAETQPWVDELIKIEHLKPMPPFIVADSGRRI